MFKRRLIAADQASVFMAMTSDHNRSELGIQDHSNEPSSSKLVPKVVPLAVKTATSRQELELLFHHHISMLRTTGGLEMNCIWNIVQIELTLEQSQQGVSNDVLAETGSIHSLSEYKMISGIERHHGDPVMQCTTPSRFRVFSQQNLSHWSRDVHLLSIDIHRDCDIE
ncbi:hypothetical protein Tco_1055308 [Tanacetum coccineum]|uniref:Uncharacterized protein n=1 Tax=Tanacetum coccineum TaxID=301880 RepID=A0ABQ5H0H3_9ASTR